MKRRLLIGSLSMISLLLTGTCFGQRKYPNIPILQFEIGYLRSFHSESYVTRKDWIQVPGTWRDPQNFPGQSTYAFTFRDTSWNYRFNHHHPMFTSRVRLKHNGQTPWQFFLVQSVMWNSWHQLSFMYGGEAIYRINKNTTCGLQIGALSGYHLLHKLQRGSLMSIDGPEGGVFAGANLTLDYSINPNWRARLAGNHALIGLGLFYTWSPKPDPAPRT